MIMRGKYHPRGQLVEGYRVQEHPLYPTWVGMKSRCYNPKLKSYKYYGARGITVCDRWLNSFVAFVEDMGPKPSPDLTLERSKNHLGYTPENCIWATPTDQCVNRRRFCNNTSGTTGVSKIRGRYQARFDYEGRRYLIGRFDVKREAAAARRRFIALFKSDREAAEALAGPVKHWCTWTTGVRGVTAHQDGGYIVRKTMPCGKRVYLGYFKDFDTAVAARMEAT